MAKRYGCFPKYVMGPSYKCRVPTKLLSLRDIGTSAGVVSTGLLSLRDMGSTEGVAPTELLSLRDICSTVGVAPTELLSLQDIGVSGWGGVLP